MRKSRNYFAVLLGGVVSMMLLTVTLLAPAAVAAPQATSSSQSSSQDTTSDKRTVTIGSQIVTLSATQDGGYAGELTLTSKPGETIRTVYVDAGDDGTVDDSYQLQGNVTAPETVVPSESVFGQARHSGTVVYTGKADGDNGDTTLTVNYEYTVGTEVTLTNGLIVGKFTYDTSGKTWYAALTDVALSLSNEPPAVEADLSDGTKNSDVSWSDVDINDSQVKRTGTLTGMLDNGQKYSVSVVARRASVITKTAYDYSSFVSGKTYSGLTPSGAYADSIKPSDTISVNVTRSDTFEDGRVIQTTSTKQIDVKLDDASETRTEDIKQRVHTGTATYAVTMDNGDKYLATFTYSYTQAVDYNLVINGTKVAFTKQPDRTWSVDDSDKPVLKLKAGTTDQLATDQSINVNNNGTLENVALTYWGSQLSFDGFTASNTFTIGGQIEGAEWSVDLSAQRPAELTGQTTDRNRTVSAGGMQIDLTKQANGTWQAADQALSINPPEQLTVTVLKHHLYENGEYQSSEDTATLYKLAAGKRSDKVSYPEFGVRQHVGTLTYTGKSDGDASDTSLVVTYSYKEGELWSLKRGIGTLPSSPLSVAGTATADSEWTLSGDLAPMQFKLTDDNKIDDSSTMTFIADGEPDNPIKVSKQSVSYDTKQMISNDGATIVVVTGFVNGTITTAGGTFNYHLPFSATRTYNDSVASLRVTDTAPDGSSTTYDQTLNAVKTIGENKYSFTLDKIPYSQIADTFTITGVDVGSDATVIVSPAQRNDDGSIIFTVLVKSPKYTNTYEVTVPFDAAPVLPDAGAAHLSDLTVNGKSIVDANGNTFDPNRLSYTIKAEENEKVYLLPHAANDVFVSAGDVTQNAGASTYRWVVSQAGKKSSTYSVTVLRDRDWKTADEAFTPRQPVAQEGTEVAGDTDTELQSHGYVDADGVYVSVSGDTYTIPSGGVFSYQAKSGQVALVTSAKIKGTTYRYTVNVAAPGDLHRFMQHVYTITYITPATQVAALTGIAVNDNDVAGFDSATHVYTVEVARTDQWTIVPKFDRTSGATVTTHKTGGTATITVVSADGLVTTVYTVNVVAQKQPTNSTTGQMGVLAQTGSGIAPLAGISAFMLIVVGVTLMLARRHAM